MLARSKHKPRAASAFLPRRPAAPIQHGSGSASIISVEQPALAAKPYIALLQQEGERKRLIDDIVDFVANKLEDPGQP